MGLFLSNFDPSELERIDKPCAIVGVVVKIFNRLDLFTTKYLRKIFKFSYHKKN